MVSRSGLAGCQLPPDASAPSADGPESSAPLPLLLIHTRPLAGWCSILKRSIDVIFSVGLLVVFSPLMLVIAVAIAVDSRGPLLFKQLRFGLNGEPIVVYKFRTMYHGAPLSTTVTQASRYDPRVTRVGAFSGVVVSMSCRNSTMSAAVKCRWLVPGLMQLRMTRYIQG